AYSDTLFHQTATDWLVATDQPLRALEHLRFHAMIDIASHAPKPGGMKIPGHAATCSIIKHNFKEQQIDLKARLSGPTVIGKINLTCDAWQASNTDGYFAVTA